jgi:hypothetical protein
MSGPKGTSNSWQTTEDGREILIFTIMIIRFESSLPPPEGRESMWRGIGGVVRCMGGQEIGHLLSTGSRMEIG